MEHVGESGVQLWVGVEMEAYVSKQQLQVTNLSASLGKSQAGNLVTTNKKWSKARSRQRSLRFLASTFQDSTNRKYRDS